MQTADALAAPDLHVNGVKQWSIAIHCAANLSDFHLCLWFHGVTPDYRMSHQIDTDVTVLTGSSTSCFSCQLSESARLFGTATYASESVGPFCCLAKACLKFAAIMHVRQLLPLLMFHLAAAAASAHWRSLFSYLHSLA